MNEMFKWVRFMYAGEINDANRYTSQTVSVTVNHKDNKIILSNRNFDHVTVKSM